MVTRILHKRSCTFLLSSGLALLLGACGSEVAGPDGMDASVADSGEVADLCTEASPCPLSSGVQRSEFIAPQGDNDDWSFQVGAANSVVNVVVSNDVDFSPVTLEVVVFNPRQQSIRNVSFQGRGKQRLEIQFSAPDAGRYIIRVRDVGGDDLDRRNPYFITATELNQTDQNEPNNVSTAATDLTEGVAASGTIGQQNDQDWFRIVVPANKLVRIEMVAPGDSEVRLQWELLAADGITRVAESLQPNEGVVWPPENRAVGSAGGTFFVRVTDWPGDGTDADLAFVYQLTVTFEDEPDANDLAAPNETFATATTVMNGIQQTGYIAAKSDLDWYRIQVTSASTATPQLIVVEADMPISSPVQLAFTVFGTDGMTQVCQQLGPDNCKAFRFQRDGDPGGTAIRTSHFVTSPGTYYVLVRDRRDQAFDTRTPYTLTVSLPAEPDRNETYRGPDAGSLTVLPIASTPTYIEYPWVEGNLSYAGDTDLFRFEIPGSSETNGGNWNGDWVAEVEYEQPGPTPIEFQMTFFTVGQNYGSTGRRCRQEAGTFQCQYPDSSNGISGAFGFVDCLAFLRERTDNGPHFVRVVDADFDDFDLTQKYRFRIVLRPGCDMDKCVGSPVREDLCVRSCTLPSRMASLGCQ